MVATMDDQVEERRAAEAVGMRFQPTQQELLWLLRFKVEGGDISEYTNHVLEKNFYGSQGREPWNVLGDVEKDKWFLYDEAGDREKKRVVYVITKLSKIGRKKTIRTAGIGTWNGQSQARDTYNYEGNKIIGGVKLLSYEVNPGFESESDAANRGHWYMHEFSLSKEVLKEIGINGRSSNHDYYVICRIIWDVSKSCQVKASSSKTTTTTTTSRISSTGKRKKNAKEGAGGNGVDVEQEKRAKLFDHHHQEEDPTTTLMMQMDYDASIVDKPTMMAYGSSSFQQQPPYNNFVPQTQAQCYGTNIMEPSCCSGYLEGSITPQVQNLLEGEEDDGGLWSHIINLSDKELAEVEESWKSCLLG